MCNNMSRVVAILQEWLEREKNVLWERRKEYDDAYNDDDEDLMDFKLALYRQKGVVSGIEIAISWIENNISTN